LQYFKKQTLCYLKLRKIVKNRKKTATGKHAGVYQLHIT